MAKKFDFTGSMLNDVSLVGNKINNEKKYKIVYLPVGHLIPSEFNKDYSVNEIERLKSSIKEHGLNQAFVVRKSKERGEGYYEIIYGHRRRMAILDIIKDGDDTYKEVPCIIKDVEDDVDMEIMLIDGNDTIRYESEADKMRHVVRLKELYEIKRKRGDKFSGTIRDIVAKELKMSPTAVQRYESINKNLIPEFREQFDNGMIKMTTAAALAAKPQEEQREILSDHPESDPVKLEDVQKKASVKETAKDKFALPAQSNIPPAAQDEAQPSQINPRTEVKERVEMTAPEHAKKADSADESDKPAAYYIFDAESVHSLSADIENWLKQGKKMNVTIEFQQ